MILASPVMVIPMPDKKITSAMWGPYEEYILTGHEDGEICQYDFKVLVTQKAQNL